jgi:hypothetical protein
MGRFEAAGILFTDGVHVLAGFQPGKAAISGFGGSREGSETIRQTAFREALEELLEPVEIPASLLQTLVTRTKEYPIIRKGSYRFLTLSFEDLLTILQEAKELKSQIYKSIPTTLVALLKKRKPTPSSEVTTLMLLPVKVTDLDLDLDLDPYFAEDLLSI